MAYKPALWALNCMKGVLRNGRFLSKYSVNPYLCIVTC